MTTDPFCPDCLPVQLSAKALAKVDAWNEKRYLAYILAIVGEILNTLKNGSGTQVGTTLALATVTTAPAILVPEGTGPRYVSIFNNGLFPIWITRIGSTPHVDTGTTRNPVGDGYGIKVEHGFLYESGRPTKEGYTAVSTGTTHVTIDIVS